MAGLLRGEGLLGRAWECEQQGEGRSTLYPHPVANNLATSTLVRPVAAERTNNVLLDEKACHSKDNLEG